MSVFVYSSTALSICIAVMTHLICDYGLVQSVDYFRSVLCHGMSLCSNYYKMGFLMQNMSVLLTRALQLNICVAATMQLIFDAKCLC